MHFSVCIHTIIASVFYLTEEVSLLLSLDKTGQVAADHQVRVIQHGIEPTSGGQERLDTQDTMLRSQNTWNVFDKKIRQDQNNSKNDEPNLLDAYYVCCIQT